MSKKKKIKIVLFLAALLLLLGIVTFTVLRVAEYHQTSYQRAFPENQGVISNIPIPKGSRPVGPYAVNGEKIKTFCSEDEINAFYQDYFRTLPKVSTHNSTEGLQAYYDEEQQLVIYDKIYFQKQWDGLYFSILYDPYGDGAGVRVMEEPKKSKAE